MSFDIVMSCRPINATHPLGHPRHRRASPSMFASDLALVEGSELAAVGSRRLEARRPHSPSDSAVRAHGSYEELAADPDVDVIYVATPAQPSPRGRDARAWRLARTCSARSRWRLNAEDAETMITEARSRGLFFAEAMWTRTNPNTRKMLQLVRDGAVGTPLQVRAELGFAAAAEKTRMWDPALGRQRPARRRHLSAHVRLPRARRADLDRRGGLAVRSGHRRQRRRDPDVRERRCRQPCVEPGGLSDNRASVAGTIRPHRDASAFPRVDRDSRSRAANPVRRTTNPSPGGATPHEIIEVADCLGPARPSRRCCRHDESLAIMKQLDEILRQLGVTPR